MILIIMANDRQPMISYLSSMVTVALSVFSVFAMEIQTTFSISVL